MTELRDRLKEIHDKYVEKDFFTAEIGIRDTLFHWPDQPDVLRLGALTALALNQVVLADQRLGRASELVPMTAEMANTHGNIRTAIADWAEAEGIYKEAISLDPTYQPAKTNLLNLYIKSGQPHRALACLDDGTDYGDLADLARVQIYAMLGRYEETLELLDTIKSQENMEPLRLHRLKCLAVLGRMEEMSDVFAGFEPTSPLIPDAIEICVNSFVMRGRRDEALDLVAKVTAPDDVEAGALLKAAQVLRREKAEGPSKAILQIAAKRFEADPNVLYELGQDALRQGDAKKGFELFNESLDRRAAHFPALLGRAQAAIVEGNYEDAQESIQAALLQAPNNQYIMALGATLQRARGQNHKALYDYDKFVRVYDIAPPEGYADVAVFNAAIQKELDALHVYSDTPINQSVRGGTQTETDLVHTENPVLRSFFKAVDAPIRDYIKAIGKNDIHPLMKRAREDYRISGAWSIRLSEDGHHVNHVHPMGWLSSAYYVDVPPTVSEDNHEGWIKFGEPAFDVGQGPEHFVRPKAGRLVLFPSYMWHGTVPFKGAQTRLTLPFDVVPA